MKQRLWPYVLATLAGLGAAMLVGTPTPAYADLPSGACALPATSASLSEGIQDQSRFVPTTGSVTATMIFVDFPDAPANDTTTSLRDRLVPSGPSWYTTSSYGRLNLSVNSVTSRFYRMPRNSVDYNYERGLTAAQHRLYITDALQAVGNSISFAGTKLLYIVPTRAAAAISFSPTYMSSVTASDGTVIGKSVTFGQDIWRTGWGGKVLNHETGHTMGLPDLYAYSGDAHRFVGGWDLMGWIPGPSPDLFAWHKWKLNWLAANQVACVSTAGQSQQTLTPIETSGGLKMAVIATSSTRAWVAEVRTTAQVNSASCSTGVLVYSVDTAVASGTGPIRISDSRPSSGGCGGNELNDAAYAVGTRFLDTATNTSISVVSRTGDNFTIAIDYAVSPGGCPGYANRFTGSLNAGQSAYHPNGSYFFTGNAGVHSACLDGPNATNFNLYLERWSGSAWATVASGTSSNPDESFTYNGTAGYYRYRVLAFSGSGAYTIGYNSP